MNKTYIPKFFRILLLLAAFMLGCDDENSSSHKNVLSVNGKDFTLAEGILSNLGLYEDSNGDYYTFRLYLFSKEIEETVYDKYEIDFEGTGQILDFLIVTTSETLTQGDYSFDDTFPYERQSFKGSLTLDNDTRYFTEGSVSISPQGDEYEVIFTCATSGKFIIPITGTYKGTLEYVE